MKKALVICLVLVMVVALAACANNNGNNGDLPEASGTDIQHFPALTALPEFKGTGTVQFPAESEDYSYFWVTATDLDAMKAYGATLEKQGWTLDETVANYDAESILYYTKGDDIVQLKFLSGNAIKVTIGNPDVVPELP